MSPGLAQSPGDEGVSLGTSRGEELKGTSGKEYYRSQRLDFYSTPNPLQLLNFNTPETRRTPDRGGSVRVLDTC